MNPPLFHLALFCHAPLSTFRISRTCFLMLATASELPMAGPPRAHSDEMDAVSINSDRAELDAADANRVVCPLRVKSVSGQVTQGAGPGIYCRGFGDCWQKMHPDNLFVDKVKFLVSF
jgi:hypothetical protein